MVNFYTKNTDKLRHIGPNFATFYGPNSEDGTSPDIFLANKHVYHNYHHTPSVPKITPEKPNTSDHLPVRVIISSKPITRTIIKPNIDKANWEHYTKKMKETTTLANVRDKPTNSIDEGLQATIENIRTASEESIPKYIVKPRPFILLSPKIEWLTKVLNKLLLA